MLSLGSDVHFHTGDSWEENVCNSGLYHGKELVLTVEEEKWQRTDDEDFGFRNIYQQDVEVVVPGKKKKIELGGRRGELQVSIDMLKWLSRWVE